MKRCCSFQLFLIFSEIAEVLRRFKYSNLHSKAVNEISQKLNDLLVYAETGKALKSDLIALAVLSRLESFEKEVKESQRTVLMTQKGKPKMMIIIHKTSNLSCKFNFGAVRFSYHFELFVKLLLA